VAGSPSGPSLDCCSSATPRTRCRPFGGQGINVALRDALVAANHLCPVLTAGGDPPAIDAATRRVRDERWPEVVAVQQLQENQGAPVLQ
jgi:2-polyprenyl-6-methoxyphenol hydroxylase and related FAD-dependent oxidoreductases